MHFLHEKMIAITYLYVNLKTNYVRLLTVYVRLTIDLVSPRCRWKLTAWYDQKL